jgi:hypothetical protein
MQDSYAALPETLPALVLLPAAAASGVSPETVNALDEELRRQLVRDGKLKPVIMGKWLEASFSRKKAASPFAFLAAIREERFSVPLQIVCKMYVFRSWNEGPTGAGSCGVHISAFPLAANSFPVSVLRFFREGEELHAVIAACLEELYERFFIPEKAGSGKRVVLESFVLEFRKLLELESGEFEFIGAPLVAQRGVTLRSGDDFFSLLVGYCLAATDMFRVMRPADFSDYAEGAVSAGAADYIIRGRVQLSDEMNILYADVYAAGSGARLLRVRHPFRQSSLKDIWDACQEVSAVIIENIFPAQAFGRVPRLALEGSGFFYRGMFIGWDSVENYRLPRGMHEIQAGSYLRRGENSKVFYVLLDAQNRMFLDREGEYVWNLLKKEGDTGD